MTKTFNTKWGKIIVRNAMLEDSNGTDLHEGVEFKNESGQIFEIYKYMDISEMDSEDVETILTENGL